MKPNYVKNFAELKSLSSPIESRPSYMNKDTMPFGPVEDTSFDPVFNVTSRKPYKGEIVTRGLIWDFYRTQMALPNDSDVLRKLGRNIEEIDQLLCDGRVKAAMNNRRAGTLSLKWTIDQNEASPKLMKLVSKMFEQFPVYEILSEMVMACFYGYNVSEVVWEYSDKFSSSKLIIPTSLTGKSARWFVYDDKNQLRVKSKVQQVQGERLPPRKFIVTRYHPRYDDPYAGREALFNACYWPVIFRKAIFQYAMQFLDKYGMPWIDVTLDGQLQEERLTEVVNMINQTYQDGILAHPESAKIQKMDMDDAKTIENYTGMLELLNREIDMAILGNNLTTEVKGGSYAAAQTLAGIRDDIVKEDVRMLEASMNQLIEWIAWYNFPPQSTLPKFRLYKSEPPTKDRAEIDVMLSKLGLKLNKAYFARTYGLNDDEFEIGAPIQDLQPGAKGNVAGAVEEAQPQDETTTTQLATASEDDKEITEEGIETKDQSTNTQTEEAIVKMQGKGYNFAEEAL